jgi:flagellar protein FlgJ
VRKRAEFRSYASLEEGFADYVRLLTSGPRYREALEQSGDNASFAQALAHAGFATDPGYAGKINAVLNGKTLGTSVAALKISSEGPLT